MGKLILSVMLLFAFSVQADGGTCGTRSGSGTNEDPYVYADNCKWSFDEKTGTLTIFGSGEMGNYGGKLYSGRYHTSAPWSNYDTKITNLKIEDGITSLGMSAFEGLINLTKVDIPNSVSEIGYAAFYDTRSLTELKLPDNPNFTSTSGSFYGMNALKDIVIPDSISSIGGVSFAYCSNLNSITITDNMGLGKIFQFGDELLTNLEDLKVYCVGDVEKCNANLEAAGYSELKSIAATTKKINGVTYVYDKNGKLVATSGHRKEKRIYTIDEANAVAGEKNRVSIKYR